MITNKITPEEEAPSVGFVPGPYEAVTIADWHEVVVYAPWSEKVRAAFAATFGDYRGAWIARLHFNNGVATREQAEANARLLKAAPALYEVIKTLLDAMEMQEGREKEELHISQPTAWHVWTNAKFHARAALSLVDAPKTKETK